MALPSASDAPGVPLPLRPPSRDADPDADPVAHATTTPFPSPSPSETSFPSGGGGSSGISGGGSRRLLGGNHVVHDRLRRHYDLQRRRHAPRPPGRRHAETLRAAPLRLRQAGVRLRQRDAAVEEPLHEPRVGRPSVSTSPRCSGPQEAGLLQEGVNGNFNSATKKALKHWQKAIGVRRPASST